MKLDFMRSRRPSEIEEELWELAIQQFARGVEAVLVTGTSPDWIVIAMRSESDAFARAEAMGILDPMVLSTQLLYSAEDVL